MRKKDRGAAKIAEALDMPLDVICDIPRTEIMGNTEISIENFRGILDYNESCIKINTTIGIIKIEGDELYIDSITDEGAFVKGRIIRLEFI